MAQTQRRARLNNIDNSGFGAAGSRRAIRLTNPDGSFNLRKTGMPWYERLSIYHTLLRLPRGQFLLAVFLFYTAANLVFAVIYYFVGVEHLAGADRVNTFFEQFTESFFFSSQTLTTVGYGRVAPVGLLANVIASMESLLGIMSFALVTGLFYARFSRPRAYLHFARHMLISPYEGGRALMIRVTTYKNNHLTDADVQLTLSYQDKTDSMRRFFQLKPEISHINSLALNWTIVHAFDSTSPLYDFSEADFRERQVEVIVNVKAFDDHFSNTVQQRTSYTFEELVYGARFEPMYHFDEGERRTILEIDKVSHYQKVTLPEPEGAEARP